MKIKVFGPEQEILIGSSFGECFPEREDETYEEIEGCVLNEGRLELLLPDKSVVVLADGGWSGLKLIGVGDE